MRLYLNRPALEAQIARTRHTGEAPSFCRIGTLDVEYVHPRWPRGGIFVQTEHDYDDRRYGLTYDPGNSTGIVAWLMPGWRIDSGPGRWHP